MEHHGSSYPCSDIGGAAGEITIVLSNETPVFLFKSGFNAAAQLPCFFDLHAREYTLQLNDLLIHHYAYTAVLAYDHCPVGIAFSTRG
jgi:hypothetical protein